MLKGMPYSELHQRWLNLSGNVNIVATVVQNCIFCIPTIIIIVIIIVYSMQWR